MSGRFSPLAPSLSSIPPENPRPLVHRCVGPGCDARPLGAHRALCACCAKSRAFSDLFPPMAKVTTVSTVFSQTGLLRFLLSPKTQMMSENNACFILKMPECCLNLLFCLPAVCSPGGGWLGGCQGKANLLCGAAHAVQKHPPLCPGARVLVVAGKPPCPGVCADVVPDAPADMAQA